MRGARDAAWDAEDAREPHPRASRSAWAWRWRSAPCWPAASLAGMGGELRKEANAGASDTAAFELTLPPVADAVAEARRGRRRRAAHILVVDDNATNRMVAQTLVEMFDCTCECAEDGAEAVEAAAHAAAST